MPYSDETLERIDSDPSFAKRYFWTVAWHARMLAIHNKQNKLKSSEDIKMIELEQRFTTNVLDNIDILCRG